MRIDIVETVGIPASVSVCTEHKGRKLNWSASEFGRKYFEPEMGIFDHINNYFATLSEQQQDNIWHAYFMIYETLNNVSDATILTIQLTEYVTELYKNIDLDAVDRWIAFRSDLQVPTRFKDEYVPSDDKPGTREKTYLKSDYTKLIGLAVALRPMVPIWGEFITSTKRDTGTNFKEYYAYMLLSKTSIHSSTTMNRLHTYIVHNLKSDLSMVDSIVEGIGSEDYSHWLLAALVVTRICVGDIRGLETMPCLVTTSYKYITQTTKPTKGSGTNASIVAKDFGNGNDDNEPSRMENYKIKEEYADGDLAPFDVYAKTYMVDQLVAAGMDRALYERLYEINSRMQRDQIGQAQQTLVMTALARFISPRAGYYMRDSEGYFMRSSATQALLWQRGHKKLAMLVTATPISNGQSIQLNGLGSMARYAKEQILEMEKIWPYTRIPVSRPNTRVVNDAIKAIDIMTEQFCANDWLLNAPDDMIVETFSASTRRIGCPHDIKLCLANFAIQVGKREFINRETVLDKLEKQLLEQSQS